MKKRQSISVSYTFLQFLYWMSASTLLCFAVTFLKATGFSNSLSGVILSLGDISGFFIVARNGELTDRSRPGFCFHAAVVSIVAQSSILLLLFILKQATGITAICFSLAIAFGQLINSINIKMFVDLLHTGNNINFGFSRSFGSLSYGLAALIVSFMIPAFGIRVIPLICFIATAAELIPIFFLKQSFSIAASKSVFSEDRQVSGGTRNTVQFLRRNRQYFTLLIGLALLFAANNSVANYMIIIIENIGGSITDLGKITCFFALLECPTMLLYSKLRGRFSSTTPLRLSLSFFFAKAVIICISQSIPMLYLAFTTQIFSTGLYAPVIVDYINENISYGDSAKAQSLAMVTATIGTIIASTITGIFFDYFHVNVVLILSTAISLSGLIICLIGLKKGRLIQ